MAVNFCLSMIVRPVNTVSFRPYAAGKIITRLRGGISDEKYSSKSLSGFGKNNKDNRRGVQQNTYRRQVHLRADLYPRRHNRNAFPDNERDSRKKGADTVGALAADYGGGTRWLLDNRFIF